MFAIAYGGCALRIGPRSGLNISQELLLLAVGGLPLERCVMGW